MTEINEVPAGASQDRDGLEPLLKLRGIDKHFGPVQALYGVDLDLFAGKVTGLCGDNGAGKSVLTRCIAGVHQPDHGQIYFEGRAGAHPKHPGRFRAGDRDGIPGSGAGRQPGHRAEHVPWHGNACGTACSTRTRWSGRRAQTLSTLRVTTVRSIRQPVASLSGGQRQSVAVAKAVMWNSKVVLLDEPTAALGVVQTRIVLDLVERLRDRGLAVMVISHNLNDVFEIADRIAVLYLGRMVAEGPAADFDRQSVVEYMTTGTFGGRPFEPAGSASGEG